MTSPWPQQGPYGSAPYPGAAGGWPPSSGGGRLQPRGAGWPHPPAGPGPVTAWAAPPPRRRGLGALLIGLVAMAVLALAGLVVTNLLSRPAEVAYQNEDYQPPPPSTATKPLPTPASEAEARDFVTRNPLYAQTVPLPVRCAARPPAVDATDAQLQAHFDDLTECLVRVWEPPLTAAGYQVTRPTVTIYGNKISTRCGTAGVNAMYCSADQQLYYSNQLLSVAPELKQSPWSADVIMAHEFGHLVQGRSGITLSVYLLRDNAPTKAADLEVARRKEQQADCFSGLFTRSASRSLGLTQADVAGIEKVFVALSDTAAGIPAGTGDHGASSSRLHWQDQGIGSSAVSACNTFIAPVSAVQ